MSLKYVQTPAVTLYSGMGVSDVTCRVVPYPVDLDGNKLTFADFGDTPTFTVDPKVTGSEEIIQFSGITDNGDNTATLTGLTRNLLSKSPYTVSGAGGKTHGSSAVVVFTDNPQLFAKLLAYINGIAITGAAIATDSILGVLRLSIGAVDPAHPIAVGDNDIRVPTANPTTLFAPLSTTPSFANLQSYNLIFGNGSDGNVTFSDQGTAPAGSTKTDNTAGATVFTLTRDVYYNNLTINSTVTVITNGFLMYAKGTTAGAGTIKFPDGAAGGNGGNGSGSLSGVGAGGSAGAASTTGRLKNIAGVVGAGGNGQSSANGNNGNSSTVSLGVNGATPAGNGGHGYNYGGGQNPGGTGGTNGTASKTLTPGMIPFLTALCLDFSLAGVFAHYTGSAGSPSGAAGCSSTSSGGGDSGGGGGGGSGASGGPVALFFQTWGGSFTIKSIGGAGGNGGIGANTSNPYGGGGGGGGCGGSGGVSLVVYGTKTWTGSYVLTGGAKGTAGAGGGAGGAGTDGVVGLTGTSIEVAVSTYS